MTLIFDDYLLVLILLLLDLLTWSHISGWILLRLSLKREQASLQLPDSFGEEFFIFGSNKNLSLGVGDADDRQYPECVRLKRPDHLLAGLYRQELISCGFDPDSQSMAERFRSPSSIPALTLARPLLIADVVMSKFHTAVLTADPFSNLYVCGVGRGGRLGLGHEDARLRFVPVQGALALKKVRQVALGLNHTMAIVDDHGELWTWVSIPTHSLAMPCRPRLDPTKNL